MAEIGAAMLLRLDFDGSRPDVVDGTGDSAGVYGP